MGEITRLLGLAREGDEDANAEIIPLVYAELRAIAGSKMRGLAAGHTLQPTALVNEAYLRLLAKDATIETRAHFFFLAARAMHDILVEHARSKGRLKRGGDQKRVSTEKLVLAIEAPADDMLALSEALELLEASNPRPHQLVLLRFFGGLTNKEAAELMGITERTALRDWRFAKTFLHSILKRPMGEDSD